MTEEIKSLIKDAYCEGYCDGFGDATDNNLRPCTIQIGHEWNISLAKKRMDVLCEATN